MAVMLFTGVQLLILGKISAFQLMLPGRLPGLQS